MIWPRSDNCCSVCGRHAIFDRNVAAGGIALGEARRFQRRLNVHPVIDDIGDELRVRQRLVRPAHDAEADMLIAAFHESRNDGVERPLAAGEHVGMLRHRA